MNDWRIFLFYISNLLWSVVFRGYFYKSSCVDWYCLLRRGANIHTTQKNNRGLFWKSNALGEKTGARRLFQEKIPIQYHRNLQPIQSLLFNLVCPLHIPPLLGDFRGFVQSRAVNDIMYTIQIDLAIRMIVLDEPHSKKLECKMSYIAIVPNWYFRYHPIIPQQNIKNSKNCWRNVEFDHTSYWWYTQMTDTLWLIIVIYTSSHKGRHYNDVIMGAIAYQITSPTIVYSTIYSGSDKKKHKSSASLAFVRGIHRWPVTGEFPAQKAINADFFYFYLMTSSCLKILHMFAYMAYYHFAYLIAGVTQLYELRMFTTRNGAIVFDCYCRFKHIDLIKIVKCHL